MAALKTRDEICRELGLGQYDPVLKEIWDIKAQLNKEANYSIDAIFERVKGVTAENVWERVRGKNSLPSESYL